MIIRELFVDQKKCDGCGICWDKYPDLFERVQDPQEQGLFKAKVILDEIPPEMIPEAEWAIYDCWQHDGSGAGSILGRGEPESPPPPE
jgi:ferredoxin